jgi:multimeric flavodoxin WrbA
MNVVILDSSSEIDPTGKQVLSSLKSEIRSRGWEVEHVLLRQRKIGNCAGDFFCWIRNPGLCTIDDDNRRIARSVTSCNLLVYLTPVAFGGYCSILKRAVDHLTQNNLPFFTQVHGEIHHSPRYGHTSTLLVIGWMDTPNFEEEAIFHHLVQRNAINMHHPTHVSGIVYADQSDQDQTKAIKLWIGQVERGSSSPRLEVPARQLAYSMGTPVRRALMLVGSPRGLNSTSSALCGYLAKMFTLRGILTETIQLYPALGSHQRTTGLLKAIDEYDLIVLAFPLYIDGLPGPVTRALELIASRHSVAQPAGKAERSAFTAIVNSGLPEAEQNHTALAICARFARQAGFVWSGGLALGGGYSVVNGTPLEQMGWRGRSIRASLELTAGNLVYGHAIPDEAVRLMAKRRIPNWMILLGGPISWMLKARKYRVEFALRRQPYHENS